MAKQPKITKRLQDDIRNDQNIKEVYFDSTGRHYFNVHKLSDGTEKNELCNYGSGLYWKHQVIAGHNPDKIKELVAKGNPDTKIVATLSREDVLEFEVKEDNELIQSISSMSKAQIKMLKALLSSADDDEEDGEVEIEK